MGTPEVRLLDGSTFLVSDRGGDIGSGLSSRVKPHLSKSVRPRARIAGSEVELCYERGDYRREWSVAADGGGPGRHGELVHFGQRPQSPYYGTCDATPLFLIVLEEYWRWTGDTDTVRELEAAARAALTWIERYGDLDGDGYLEYATRNPRHGMANQCWKDSPTSIVYPDGRLAPLSRAEAEHFDFTLPAAAGHARPTSGAGHPAGAARGAGRWGRADVPA